MIVKGNIATDPEKKTSSGGKDYYRFRLAENFGRGEQRTTTWYQVMAFGLSELDADLLNKGQLVKVKGRLEPSIYEKRDGEKEISLTVMAFSVEPIEASQLTED